MLRLALNCHLGAAVHPDVNSFCLTALKKATVCFYLMIENMYFTALFSFYVVFSFAQH